MTHPLETSPMRRRFERMNAPQMFRDRLGAWIWATLAGFGLVIAGATWLAHAVPL